MSKLIKTGCANWRESLGDIEEGTSGVIQSPNYPNGLAHRIYCTWHIRGPEDRRIKIEVDDLDMPEPIPYVGNNVTRHWCKSRLSVSQIFHH